MSQTLRGKVKWFNDAKGYGFIEHDSGRDVFVHYSVIETEGYKTLKDGEPVEYELTDGDKGLHAKRVARVVAPQKVGLADQIDITSSNQPKQDDDGVVSGSEETPERVPYINA